MGGIGLGLCNTALYDLKFIKGVCYYGVDIVVRNTDGCTGACVFGTFAALTLAEQVTIKG